MDDGSQATVTDTDKSALVQILVCFLFSISATTGLVRIGTKIVYVRKFEADDLLILIAVILAIGQSTAVWISTKHGFGQQISTLHDSQIEVLTKSQYAANMLDTAVLYLIKLSVLSFIKSLTAVRLHHHLVTGLQVVVTIWAVSAEFAMAFLCGLPSPWNYINSTSTCLDHRLKFWTYHIAMNIITETGQILLILGIIFHLHVSLRRKINLCLIFGARIFVIALIGAQLAFLHQASSSKDLAFDLWPYVACTQGVQCASFFTACVPYLKPFLKSLESGLFRIDDLHGFATTLGDGRMGMSTKEPKGKTSPTVKESIHSLAVELDALRTSQLQPYTKITASAKENPAWDQRSRTSQSRIIMEERSWEVSVGNNQGIV